jgi:ATP-binding protein involved in chromosome partitioning
MDLRTAIHSALASVRHERSGGDVVSAGLVSNVTAHPDGSVDLDFLLSMDDPATLVREVRAAVRAVPGVAKVRINVIDPAAAPAPEGTVPTGRPQARAAPQRPPDAQFGKVIAISSGKGGVGKSTITVNLAVLLAARGLRIGLLDADVYGPNIPRMLGCHEKPGVMEGKLVPLEGHGVRVMSLGLLMERDVAAIWRGPIVMKVIQQFLRDVEWGELDFLLVDMPPGTGDAQLSLVQLIQVSGAVIVTTPQEVAVGDSLRGAKMFDRVGVPVIGIVENMSAFVCPHCGTESEVFLAGGGQRLADELSVPLLGRVPLQAGVTAMADEGRPVALAEPDTPAARALAEVAEAFERQAGGKTIRLPVVSL